MFLSRAPQAHRDLLVCKDPQDLPWVKHGTWLAIHCLPFLSRIFFTFHFSIFCHSLLLLVAWVTSSWGKNCLGVGEVPGGKVGWGGEGGHFGMTPLVPWCYTPFLTCRSSRNPWTSCKWSAELGFQWVVVVFPFLWCTLHFSSLIFLSLLPLFCWWFG